MREEPIELVFHNVHDHGVKIIDLWTNEVEMGRNRGTKALTEMGIGKGEK